MNQNLSITTLILQASPIVQLVVAGLAITSLISWAVIFGKLFGLPTRTEIERATRDLVPDVPMKRPRQAA